MSVCAVESTPMACSRARTHLAAVAVVAGLAAAPSGASAQGAGDDQYTDPFQSTSTTKAPSTKPTVTKRPQAPSTSAPPPPAQTAAPTATPATATPSAAPAATSAKPALARTGFDTRLLLLAGVALMAAGAALRLRPR